MGWSTVGSKKRTTERPATSNFGTHPATGSRKQQPEQKLKQQLIKASRMPYLPKGDFKIIIRPKGGLNIAELGAARVASCVYQAAGIPGEHREDDTVCLNVQQNIIVVSTPSESNADRYQRVERLVVNGQAYETNAYESAPDLTSKGVIRGIPLEDSPRDITAQVVTPKNPTAIAAKRLSNTTNVIVLFSGLKVPTFVRYGGALIKCALYRKQLDLCHQCGRLGHRMDVCPSPQDRVCRGCGTANAGPDHQCNPCCQLCGGEHLTADRQCKARFKMPYIVKRRRWERQRQREEELLASEATREAGPFKNQTVQITEPHTRSGPTQIQEPYARTTTSTQRSRSRSRSRGSGLAAATYKVGWVDVVKGSSRRGGSGETAAFREMAEMRRENAQLRELIANLTREIQELKNNRKADISPRPSSSHGGAAAETPDNRMEEDDNPPPPKRKAPAVISQTGSQLTDQGQKLTDMQSALKDQAEAVGNLTLAISTTMLRLDKFENNVATLSLRVAKLQPVTTAGAPTTGVACHQFENAATSTAAVSGVVQSTTPQSSTSRTEQNRQTR
ncbi:hypothetical protein HPB52_005842 [Rhipicephalus sanguineus]|uniref:CCHC-type domain-containing protein n=1 Tax=Rhipicephalus sanguineus TaxID=34632 RepID=A0A9D4SRR7_RHISA|nr:hypothetical protein HPB52_005842 [Rhipicephalus sanguineus]